VANTLRLLRLPEEVKERLEDGSISPGHGRALLSLETEDDQKEACKAVVQRGLSVRQTERMVRRWGQQQRAPSMEKEPEDLEQRELLDDLRRCLSTKIRISRRGKGGKIEIEFYSPDELQRIVDLILGGKGV
jgi:ParB family chromosome partitioning protein